MVGIEVAQVERRVCCWVRQIDRLGEWGMLGGGGGEVVLYNLRGEGLGGGFWTARAVYEPFAIGQFLKDLRCAR